MKTLFIVYASAMTVAAAPNPYGNIPLRNIFNLVSPKPKTPKPQEVFKPAPEYKLAGIAGFGSHKWALISRADPGKPPQQFILREGEHDGALEVLRVDEVANVVRIHNDGSVIELTFSTNVMAHTGLATKKFVDEHARAYEQRERIRERALPGVVAERNAGETPGLSEQAVVESQR
jgi:hypothetical protein